MATEFFLLFHSGFFLNFRNKTESTINDKNKQATTLQWFDYSPNALKDEKITQISKICSAIFG